MPSIAPLQLTESGYAMSAKSPVMMLPERRTNANESWDILSPSAWAYVKARSKKQGRSCKSTECDAQTPREAMTLIHM